MAKSINPNTTLEEGELEQSICSFAEKSWYEECEESVEKMPVSVIKYRNSRLY